MKLISPQYAVAIIASILAVSTTVHASASTTQQEKVVVYQTSQQLNAFHHLPEQLQWDEVTPYIDDEDYEDDEDERWTIEVQDRINRIEEGINEKMVEIEEEIKEKQRETEEKAREAEREADEAQREAEQEAGEAQREAEMAQREAEQEAKEAQREAEQEAREAQREAEQEAEEAKREAELEAKEAQREAEQEKREAQREAEEEKREKKILEKEKEREKQQEEKEKKYLEKEKERERKQAEKEKAREKKLLEKQQERERKHQEEEKEHETKRSHRHVRSHHDTQSSYKDSKPSSPRYSIRFAHKLQQDTESFISDLHDWLSEWWGSEDDIQVKTEFTLTTSGPLDLRRPCGDLVGHKFFNTLEPFIVNPQEAVLSRRGAKKILWHPSDECLYEHNTVEVDGGAHAEFQAVCDNQVLLNASIASGGVTRQVFWHNVEASGAVLAVDYLNGTVTTVGASGPLGIRVKYRNIPDNTTDILHQIANQARECARQHKLVISGVVGGGWRQEFKLWDDEESNSTQVSVVGYAEAFHLSFGTDDESTSIYPVPTFPTGAPNVTEKPEPVEPVSTKTDSPTESPVTVTPTTAPPTTSPPTSAPNTSVPPTNPPTPAPQTNSPSTVPPTTIPPTHAPTTTPPTTTPKTTSPPTTAPTTAPTTSPPTTAPTTIPPTTSPPTTAPTTAPTTIPPTTSPPTRAPTTAPPTTAPPTSSPPATAPVKQVPVTEANDNTTNTTVVTSSPVDLQLREMSEHVSSLYVRSGYQCHAQTSSESCFMNTALMNVMHNDLPTKSVQMSYVREKNLTPDSSSISITSLVMLSVAGVVIVGIYTTSTRRRGYASIPSQA